MPINTPKPSEELRTRIAMIGRPGIGGEFLEVTPEGYGRYKLNRVKRLNTQRDEKRQMNVSDLPGDTMVYDLLGAIEAIVEHMGCSTDYGVDLDDHGIDGTRPSLRERFQALADRS